MVFHKSNGKTVRVEKANNLLLLPRDYKIFVPLL